MSLSGSYTARNFEVLRADNSNGEDLRALAFDYMRVRLASAYQLSNNVAITLDGYLNNRNSNRTNVNKIFFRSYNYYHIGIGLQVDF